jgi:hypothetical protein
MDESCDTLRCGCHNVLGLVMSLVDQKAELPRLDAAKAWQFANGIVTPQHHHNITNLHHYHIKNKPLILITNFNLYS